MKTINTDAAIELFRKQYSDMKVRWSDYNFAHTSKETIMSFGLDLMIIFAVREFLISLGVSPEDIGVSEHEVVSYQLSMTDKFLKRGRG